MKTINFHITNIYYSFIVFKIFILSSQNLIFYKLAFVIGELPVAVNTDIVPDGVGMVLPADLFAT